MMSDYGFCAWPPERNYICCRSIDTGCGGTEAELRRWFEPGCGIVPISEITSVCIGGLYGHELFYKEKRRMYYELRLDLGEGVEFVFWIETRARNIRQIVASDEEKAAIGEIRRETDIGLLNYEDRWNI